MDYSHFNYSLDMGHPPEEFSEELKAMWYDRKGDWETAHTIVQDMESKNSAWVHAYLHRKEGDKQNAAFWYNRAGKTMKDIDLNDESRDIIKKL
jgi:hypothetical protein